MTDFISCPECDGHGQFTLGPLRLLCEFCHGAGQVGGDNEPADGDESTEFDPYTDASPVWERTVRSVPGCSMCFGAGVVANVGDIRDPSKLVEAPCPACSARSSRSG